MNNKDNDNKVLELLKDIRNKKSIDNEKEMHHDKSDEHVEINIVDEGFDDSIFLPHLDLNFDNPDNNEIDTSNEDIKTDNPNEINNEPIEIEPEPIQEESNKEEKGDDSLRGLAYLKNLKRMESSCLKEDIEIVKKHLFDNFGLSEYLEKLINTQANLSIAYQNAMDTGEQGLANSLKSKQGRIGTLISSTIKVKDIIQRLKDIYGLTNTSNEIVEEDLIDNNLITYLLWHMTSNRNEYDATKFVTAAWETRRKEWEKETLIDIALSIIVAFKKEDLLSLTLNRLYVENKIFNVFYSYRYELERLRLLKGVHINTFKKELVNKFKLDEHNDKDWIEDVMIMLSIVFEIDYDKQLTPDELARIVYNSNDVLPAKVKYNKPYSFEFLKELFNMQGIRNSFSISQTTIRNVKERLDSMLINLNTLITSNHALKSSTLTNRIDKLTSSVNILAKYVENEKKEENIIMVNDWQTNDLEIARKNKEGYLSKEYLIKESEEYEQLLIDSGSINFMVSNPKENVAYTKDINGKIVKIPLSNILFTQVELNNLRKIMDKEELEGIDLNEFYTNRKLKE